MLFRSEILMAAIDFTSWILMFAVVSVFAFLLEPSVSGFLFLFGGIVTVYFVGGVLFYILVRLSKYNEIPLDVAGQKICLFCWMVNKKFDIIRGNRETD